jgi:hypothetical protein
MARRVGFTLSALVPGRWTPRAADDPTVEVLFPRSGRLGAHEPAELLRTVRSIDALACGRDVPEYWDSRPRFLDELDALLIGYVEGHAVAFMALQDWKLGGTNVLYLDATAVTPHFQDTAVGTLLLSRSVLAATVARLGRPYFLALRTESPVVATAMRSIFGDDAVFPRFERPGHAPPPVVALAGAVAQRLAPDCPIDLATFVVRASNASVGGFFFSSLPRARSRTVMRFFDEHVDSRGGDAVVILVPIGASAALRPARAYAAKRHSRRHGPLLAQSAP